MGCLSGKKGDSGDSLAVVAVNVLERTAVFLLDLQLEAIQHAGIKIGVGF